MLPALLAAVRRVPRALALAALAATALGAQQPARDSLHAVLVGRVADSTGTGLAGAEIGIIGSETPRTISGDSGAFLLRDLPTGIVVFRVRRLGYEPATFTANLHGGRMHRATFVLSASAQPLPAVAVTDTARSHWLDVFEDRRAHNRGTFITRADVEKSHGRSATDLVRTTAGLTVIGNGAAVGQQVVATRGAGARSCTPTLYVHDTPYSGSLDDFPIDDIEALEVYVGVSEIPPELNRTLRTYDARGRPVVGTPCAVIVVWTRAPRP